MLIVIGLALAVIAAVVAVVVLGGGDDDRDASDEPAASEPTDDPDIDADVTTTGPADTVVVASTAPTDATDATDGTDATPPSTQPAPDTTATPLVPAGDLVDGAPPGQTGTSAAPVPVGEIADIGNGWRLQVLDVVPDASTAVVEENQFNDPPPAGSTFTLVRVAFGYFGLDDPQSFFMPTITGVGDAGRELDTDCGVIPDQFDIFTDAFAGGVAVGNLCFVTTAADTAVLSLRATGEFLSDTEAHLAAQAPPAPVTPMGSLTGARPGAAATAFRSAATPVGTAADLGSGWSFAVMSPGRDITDAVLAENFLNEPPPDGFRMVGVDIALAYAGEGTGSGFDVTVNWVDDGNLERSGFCGVVPGEFDLFADVPSGGSVTGTLCVLVPTEFVGTSVLYVNVGFDGPSGWFRTS